MGPIRVSSSDFIINGDRKHGSSYCLILFTIMLWNFNTDGFSARIYSKGASDETAFPLGFERRKTKMVFINVIVVLIGFN